MNSSVAICFFGIQGTGLSVIIQSCSILCEGPHALQETQTWEGQSWSCPLCDEATLGSNHALSWVGDEQVKSL